MKKKISMVEIRNKRKTKFLKMVLRNIPLLIWVDLEGNKFAFKFSFCAIEEIGVFDYKNIKLAKKICDKYHRRNHNE